MNPENQRSRIEDDDSLLASVAGVPLTRSARIGAALVWAAFWATRTLLTDAIPHLNQGNWKPALLELLGENPFDQGLTICMAWLTVEVAVILWNYLKTGVSMLIAKTGRPFWAELARRMPTSLLAAELERRKSNDADKPPNGKKRKD